MLSSLTDLTGVEGRRQFLDHFARKVRLRLRCDAAQDPAQLLPWSEVDRLIARGAIPGDRFRVTVDGVNAPRHIYLDPESGRILPGAIQDFVAQGATLIIPSIHLLTPAIGALAAALERELSHPVSINAYLTFGERTAFRAHCDDHDVVVLQIYGAKRWRCYGESERFPLEGGLRPTPGEPLLDEVLEAGDVLYVPRGDIHVTTPARQPSAHLTIGLSEATGVDFIKWLSRRAAASEVFRQELPRHASADERRAREAAVKAALHALVDHESFQAFWNHDDRSRSPRASSALAFAGRLSPATLIGPMLTRRIDLDVDQPGEVEILIAEAPYRLSQLARRVLDAQLHDGPRPLAALALAMNLEPDDGSLLEALSALAGRGLIEIV